MADTQPNSETNIGLNGMAIPNTNQSLFMSAPADQESSYVKKMVDMIGTVYPNSLTQVQPLI